MKRGPFAFGGLVRPTKFTATLGATIIRFKAGGATHEVAASAVGIPKQTLCQWLRKGEAGLEPYRTFAEAFRKAEDIARRKVIAEAAKAMGRALSAA